MKKENFENYKETELTRTPNLEFKFVQYAEAPKFRHLSNLLTGAWALRDIIKDLKNSSKFETLETKIHCMALDDAADALEEIVRLKGII